ncbi:MAG: hypothetical protein ACO1OQ_07415 [Rufibacter sp.]
MQRVPVLKASALYVPEKVRVYLQSYANQHEEMAASYLAKAREVEETNLTKAIYFTKRAITVQPSKEKYLQLAQLLRKAQNFDELQKVYEFLSLDHARHLQNELPFYVFGEPDEEILYEFLAVNLITNSYHTGSIVEQAKKLGIPASNLKKRLLADKRLGFTESSADFQSLQFYFLTDKEREAYANSDANFRNFLGSIKDSATSFEIDPKAVAQFNYHASFSEFSDEIPAHPLAEYFVYFLPEKKEDPEAWPVYEIRRKARISKEVVAVVYAVDSSEAGCPVEMRHLYHRLVTYGKKGKLIQSLVVAEQNGEQLSTLSFNQNQLTITDYKRLWKKPYQKKDFDNYLMKNEPVRERRYEIRPDGSILEAQAPSPAQPDSLVAQAAPVD